MDPKAITMVEYYEAQAFNPVLIRVEDPTVWEAHVQKRRHLYERHLGIALPLLRDKHVLEFGCNSGENALVLATFGARLTLVEPNRQVAPRLKHLFQSFGLEAAIEAFHETGIDTFQTDRTFDVVVAEGFLSTLTERDAMLEKILRLVKPGGFGIVSFNDRFGGLLEVLKRAILFRAYALTPVADVQSDQALNIARTFFEADFQKLNVSRTFEAWWRDTLVNPLYSDAHLWSYPELLAILQRHGGVVHATSPVWSTWEHYNWYKNVPGPETVNQRFLEDWRRHLFYFLTGLRPASVDQEVPEEVIEDTAQLVRALSRLGNSLSVEAPNAIGAARLLPYLASASDRQARAFAVELEHLLGCLVCASPDELLSGYRASHLLRSLWGTAYHYLCFRNTMA